MPPGASDAHTPQRRRGTRLEHAILGAAADELVEHGWADFNLPRVASRAGAGKASLYARWPTKGALVAAVLVHLMAAEGGPDVPADPAGDAPDLATDLHRLMARSAAALGGAFGPALRGVVADLSILPSDRSALLGDTVVAPDVQQAVDRARARGELGERDVHPRILNLGLRLSSDHYLFLGRTPDPEAVRQIVADIWLPALHAAAGTNA